MIGRSAEAFEDRSEVRPRTKGIVPRNGLFWRARRERELGVFVGRSIPYNPIIMGAPSTVIAHHYLRTETTKSI
jgi:hypothetical protein